MHPYVQYGCGLSCPEGWENFDASPTLRFERLPLVGRLYTKNAARFPAGVRYGDIVRGLPVPDGSCEGVYASHVVEHLSLADARTALRNSLKLLRPGGRFRVIVPDLRALTRSYLDDPSPEACSRFMEKSLLGRRGGDGGWQALAGRILGNGAHLWFWDEPGLTAELRAAGFAEVRPAKPGDSGDPLFDRVEDPARFVDAVALQARRPGE